GKGKLAIAVVVDEVVGPGVDPAKRLVVPDLEVGRVRDRILPQYEIEDVARVLRELLDLVGTDVEHHDGMRLVDVRQGLGLPDRIPESVEHRPQLAKWSIAPIDGRYGLGGVEETPSLSRDHAELARSARTVRTADAAVAGLTPNLELG